MNKYQKQHYEDVVSILSSAYEWNGCRSSYPDAYKSAAKLIIQDFANLFTFRGGFDREQFLIACGLEVAERIHDGRCGESGCSVCGLEKEK